MTTANLTMQPTQPEMIGTVDMQEAIRQHKDAECYLLHGGRNTGTLVYIPSIGRGAVCEGGNSEWSDADSAEDLLARYQSMGTDDDRWSN